MSDSGVSSEVVKRWVTTAGTEGPEVDSLGKVGSGVGERSGVSAGITAASGVDKVRPGVIEVRSEFIREARSGLGDKVSGGSEVTFRVEAAWGMSVGTESEVTGGSGGSGEAEGAEEGAGGAVLAAVGRCGRRSGHSLHSFLREPVSPEVFGVEEGWPGLRVVPVVRVGPGMPPVGVPLGRAPPEGISHVREGS